MKESPGNCFDSLFERVVAVIFQSVFHLKIYQNNIFLFFKINVLK